MIENGHFFDVFVTPFKRAVTQKSSGIPENLPSKKLGDNSYTYGQKNVKVDLNNLSDLVILPFNDDKPQDQESIELSIMD